MSTLRPMSTVSVILAADPGEGFSEPKYLTPVHGTPLLERVIGRALLWPVDEIVVVLGSNADIVASSLEFADVSVLVDPEWEEGAASPLRAALDFVSRDLSVDLIVLARGDQPGIERDVVTDLIETARESDADAVVPKYRYARSWPVVIGPALWGHFLGLEGQVDVLDVITTHAGSVEEVWIDRLAPRIIDTLEDAQRSTR
jgi:molybdenum cofactor cytidylyltransferase